MAHAAATLDLSALTLNLDLSRTRSSGLTVTLTSPSGKSETVPTGPGSINSNFDLSTAFAGEPTAGDWTLTVSDSLKSDQGTLNSWSLSGS